MAPTPDLVSMVEYYDDPSPRSMLGLIHRFVFDTGRFGDDVEQIAADRADYAARPDIRRSHERTFWLDGPPLVFAPEVLADIENEVLLRPRPGRPDHPRGGVVPPRAAPPERPAARAPAHRPLGADRAG